MLPLRGIFTGLLIFFISGFAYAHPGGLDKNGCHTNHKTGEYHCHGTPSRSAPAPVTSTPPQRDSSSANTLGSFDLSSIEPPKDTTCKVHLLYTFTGKVVGVNDGDTIEVMHNGKSEKIRLYGIDCPEGGQAFSNKAKAFTSSLLFGKEVTAKVFDHDKYGRTVADIISSDGINANQQIVKAGYGWWYEKYAPNDATLKKFQTEAKAAERGLWADSDAMPPWQYRTSHNNNATASTSNLIDLAESPNQKVATDRNEITVYVTRTGAKYHLAGCRHLKSVIPITLKEAKERGYTPCSVCRPPQ